MLNTPAHASPWLITAFSRQRRPETSRFISIRKFGDRREKKNGIPRKPIAHTNGFTPAFAITLGLHTEVRGDANISAL